MADEAVTLWGIGTMRTHRPLWLTHELGIDCELKAVLPRSGETKTPEFLALNPRHKIPVLQHGDFVLTESVAILNYLADSFSAPADFFVPGDASERARLDEWCSYAITELDSIALYTIRRHGDLSEIYGEAPNAVTAARDYFNDQIDGMDERFRAAGPFLMGERFSIADIVFVSCLDFARAYDFEFSDHVTEYRVRMRARPAYRESFALNYPGKTVEETN